MRFLCLLFLFSFYTDVDSKHCTKPKPTRSYLHNIFDQSDIIVTAIISGITYRADSLYIESINILPLRIFKGREYVNGSESIKVENVMEAELCPHRLLSSELRVFALSAQQNTFLLESPLIRLSLPVLDSLHTISRGMAHRKRRKTKHTTCEASICPIGSKCVLKTGVCECKAKCRFASDVVCGSDNVSYSSFCHLSVRSCVLAKKGIRLRVSSKGSCKKRNPCEDLRCGPGEECVVNQDKGILVAKCLCPTQCPNYGDSVESSPVCSSHGVDYQSSCHLRHHACESKTNITVKFYGRCDPCHGHKCSHGLTCQLGTDRKPECRCSEQCPLNYAPVCGTDGQTYTNECMLKLSACKKQEEIKVWKTGKCDEIKSPCEKMECGFWSVCKIKDDKSAVCECVDKCENVMRPVCATSGETFDNECEMKKRSCKTKTNIRVKHQGTCGIGVCATFNACKKPQVCVVADGKPKCMCPTCTDELKEVCGNDGRTYSNECKLRREACLSQSEIYVKYNSVCEGCENKKCDFYSSCVVSDKLKSECKCPNNCPSEEIGVSHQEVCGTDGVTYSSECHLRKSACHQKKFIVVAFDGKCDACLHVQCRYGEECRGGMCVCSYNCPINPPLSSRICGENGILYPSICHLQLASCQKGAPISEMPPSHCHSALSTFPARRSPSCSQISCNHGAMCLNGQCICPICNLSAPYPICGSDGIIYSNQCHLNTISCRDQRDIHVLPLLHQCSDKFDKCECNRVGSFGHVCDETGQCKCRPGVSGMKCDHCLPSFWGIHLIAQGALSCRPCGCSVFGSARLDCEQTTGKCECRNGAIGDKCNLCPVGMMMTSDGCVSAVEYKTPRDCASLRCHHGAKCVPAPASFPDCVCPTTCNMPNMGIVSNMTVCGTDGITYNNLCELKMFACKHQIDVVPVSMGICDDGNMEILDRLQREQGNAHRLGSSCDNDDDCEKLGAYCVTRPGRKSVCECTDGWKSEQGVCEEQIKYGKDSNQLDVETNLDRDFYVKMSKARLYSKIVMHVTMHEKKDGTLLRMVTDDSQDLQIIYENRRIIIKIGKTRVESLQTVAYNVSLELKWSRNEMHIKLNGEIQKHKFDGFLDSNVSRIFLSSDGKWASNRIRSTFKRLEIDGVAVRKNDIHTYYLAPEIHQKLKFGSSAFLKFENLQQDVREISFFEVVIKPYNSNGLIFYWSSDSKSDFVALSLIDAKIHFVFDLGSGLFYLKSDPIVLNQWKTIKIERVERKVKLFLDGTLLKSMTSQGQNSHLDFSKNTSFFVGFVPDDEVLSRKIKKLNVPFEGEIQMIRINEFPINLIEGLTKENQDKLDVVVDHVEEEKCLRKCEGSCFEKMGKMVCRPNENDDSSVRGIHISEEVELYYPNNGAYSVASSKQSNFSLEFRTLKEYGVLWFEGGWSEIADDADFLILFVDEGKLYFGVNLGNDHSLKPISTNISVADNRWHHLRFRRKERKCELWLDDDKVLTVVTSPGNTSLENNGIVYLGGPIAKKHKQLKRLELTQKFVGCVRNMKIMEKHVNLLVDSLDDIEQPKYCHN